MGHHYSLGRERRTRGDSFSQFHFCYLGCRNGQQDTPCPKNIDHDLSYRRFRIQRLNAILEFGFLESVHTLATSHNP